MSERTAGHPRLCLTGGWFSSDNIGDHSILSGLVDALGRRFDEPTISVITANPTKVMARYGLSAFAPKRHPLRLLRNLGTSDALLFTGGTPFYNSATHMSYYAAIAKFAAARRVPVAVFGISLRSVKSRYEKFQLRRILASAKILGAREDRTLQAFADIVGEDDPRLILIPDAATQMSPSSPDRGRELISAAGADPGRTHIALTMRDFRSNAAFQAHHFSRSFDEAALQNYHDTCRALIEHAVRRHDVGVLLCPMHTISPDDDRRVLSEVLASITDRTVAARVTLIDRQHDPRDMKAILGVMRACIGVRFHSLVLSASMNVPVLSLAYAHKSHSIMQGMDMGRFSLDLATADRNNALALFDEIMANHSSFVRLLETHNAEQQIMYSDALDRLSDVVGV